jgi:xylan 1,4-beta-xylosidase
MTPMPHRKPVVSGLRPDPSVCRVGEDYYMVNSTFEYSPGVPIRHSRDLVNWRLMGHCLTRPSQLPLDKCRASGGIFAPTIRYHRGRFYMVTTNIGGGGNLIVHTDDPAGDWSEPVWLGLGGINPSLLFEDDTCYFTSAGDGMVIATIDPLTGEVIQGPVPFWRGNRGQYPEAQHLYKVKGRYYALLAERSAEYGHMVTVARGNTPRGPWEMNSKNPFLSHRSMNSPIQATGHAELVQGHDGNWWMVFLGVRPVRCPPCYHLGRQTFLAPVTWERGWPVVNDEQRVPLQSQSPTLPLHPWPPTRSVMGSIRKGLRYAGTSCDTPSHPTGR